MSINGGSLEISPDRNILYYGQVSGSTLYKIDISSVTPTVLLQTQTGDNGQALALSHNGSFVCLPNGAPYQIAEYRTSDFATLGTFITGAYPRQIGFSPDNLVAYAVHTGGEINVFDTDTFLSIGTILASGEASRALTVDSTGRSLRWLRYIRWFHWHAGLRYRPRNHGYFSTNG